LCIQFFESNSAGGWPPFCRVWGVFFSRLCKHHWDLTTFQVFAAKIRFYPIKRFNFFFRSADKISRFLSKKRPVAGWGEHSPSGISCLTLATTAFNVGPSSTFSAQRRKTNTFSLASRKQSWLSHYRRCTFFAVKSDLRSLVGGDKKVNDCAGI
jgi:hypothetical protein